MKQVIDEILVEATILGMMREASSYEDFAKNKIPGIGNKPITIHSALSYKGHDDFSQRSDKQKVYSDAIQNLQGGIESGELKKNQVPDDYADEVQRKSPEPKSDDDGAKEDPARSDQAPGNKDVSGPDSIVADDPPKKKDKDKDSDGRRMIGDKDKTLKDVDSTTTEEFQRELEPSDEEFEKRNKKFANPIPPPAYKAPEGLLDNPNFPKKYVKALERLINTQPIGDAKRWGHYSDIPGGAGRVQAQAGELMTMMGASMNDEDFETFINSIDSHVDELVDKNPNMKKDSTRSVPKSWVKSAVNNRQAILNRVREEYPDAEIVATSWDTKDDVESLGLDDYDKNKGFSTDMYMKIRTADGDVLDEISLKKDVNVNFLNAGTGSFSKWDPDLPDEINPNVYARTQRENLAKTGKKLSGSIEKLLSSGKNTPEIKAFKALMKSKKIDFSQALEDTMAGKGSRAKSNVVQAGIAAMAAAGNKDAQKFMKDVDSRHRAYNAAAIEAIVSNDKLKEGMLKEIRSEFPLKAVGEGEETMAIGDLSLDRATMRNIFGTDDFDTIKQRLSAEPGPPPYLSYKAGPEDEVIPLAEIVVREDGVGYGANFKFEMTLDKRFAKKLREANEAVYGGSKNESVVYDHIQTLLEMARQV